MGFSLNPQHAAAVALIGTALRTHDIRALGVQEKPYDHRLAQDRPLPQPVRDGLIEHEGIRYAIPAPTRVGPSVAPENNQAHHFDLAGLAGNNTDAFAFPTADELRPDGQARYTVMTKAQVEALQSDMNHLIANMDPVWALYPPNVIISTQPGSSVQTHMAEAGEVGTVIIPANLLQRPRGELNYHIAASIITASDLDMVSNDMGAPLLRAAIQGDSEAIHQWNMINDHSVVVNAMAHVDNAAQYAVAVLKQEAALANDPVSRNRYAERLRPLEEMQERSEEPDMPAFERGSAPQPQGRSR